MPSARATLDLNAGQISFVTLRSVPNLGGPLEVLEMVVSGARVVERTASLIDVPDNETVIAVRPVLRRGVQGKLTLQLSSASVQPGARVELRARDADGFHRLIVSGSNTEFKASTNGPVLLVRSGDPPTERLLMASHDISFWPLPSTDSAQRVAFDVLLNTPRTPWVIKGVRAAVEPPLRVEETGAGSGLPAREVSVLQSGTLAFDATGDTHELTPSAPLRYSASGGTIDELTVGDSSVRVVFTATLQNAWQGESAEARNLMPRVIEWVKSPFGLASIVVTTLSLAALFFKMDRWLGGSGEA